METNNVVEKKEHVYLLQQRSNVILQNNIYKIGQTTRGIKRIEAYEKGYKLYLLEKCYNSKKIESQIIQQFTKKYKKVIGREHFEGDLNSMIIDINEILINENYEESITTERNTKIKKTSQKNRKISIEPINIESISIEPITEPITESITESITDTIIDTNIEIIEKIPNKKGKKTNKKKQSTDIEILCGEIIYHILEELDNYIIQTTNDDINELYNNYKSDFEKEYFYIKNTNEFYKNTNGFFVISNKTFLKNYIKIKYKNQYFNFYNKWKNDENKYAFENFVFEPNKKIHNAIYYNLFYGFKYDTQEINDIYYILDTNCLIKILKNCFPDENEYIFFINWIAHIIQFPDKKTEKCIIIYCEKNDNFNYIIQIFLKLFDKYESFINYDNIDDNNIYINKLFLYGLDRHNKKNILDELDNKMYINREKIDKINNNYCNIIIKTNNLKNVVNRIGQEKFYVINYVNISNEDINNINIDNNDNNDDMLYNIFSYLKQYNICENILTNTHQLTNSQITLKNKLVPPFLYMIYKNPEYFKKLELTAEQIFDLSIKYIKKTKYDLRSFESNIYKYVDTLCIRDISTVFNDIKKKTNGNRLYVFYEYNRRNSSNSLETYIKTKIETYISEKLN